MAQDNDTTNSIPPGTLTGGTHIQYAIIVRDDLVNISGRLYDRETVRKLMIWAFPELRALIEDTVGGAE